MKQTLSSFSIVILFIWLAIIGLCLIPLLNVQLLSSYTQTSLNVSFFWPNASAKIIEQEVTSKLEGLFSSIKGVGDISSTSEKGKGDINIQFKKNVDMDAARFEMANLVRQAYTQLPMEVSYPQLSISSANESLSPILSYSINSNESPYFIKKFADNNLFPKLSNIPGVSRVKTYGAAPFEWVITYDADKLISLGLTSQEIERSINIYLRKENLGKGNLYTATNSHTREIPIQLSFRTAEKINWERIPIKNSQGRIIYLNDIAKVLFKESPPNAYYRINGMNTLSLVIYPEEGVNIIELAGKVKSKVEKLKKEISQNYQLKLTQDSSTYLVEQLQKIKLRSLFSFFFLLVLVFVFYRNYKYLLILFLGILTTLLISIILYYLFEVQLQLYSFAGITISFGIIIDNNIIMMDQVRNKGDKKAFLAILAATLTTLGAITIILLLEEDQRKNLLDFALVIAINLGVSLLVSYYLVPALMERFNLGKKQIKIFRKRKRRIVRFTTFYTNLILFFKLPTPKWSLILLLILGFGIPIHLIPKRMEGEGFWEKTYNHTLGSEWFSKNVRTSLEKVIGGSLRLFTENVFENSYYVEPERTTLRVTGAMPEGCTIKQLDIAIQKMEQYIASFDEVELFETKITSYRDSNINIYFKKKYETGVFPYKLKSLLESRSISLGGLDWTISGVGRGFSNSLGAGFKTDGIVLEGYNYDKLYEYAQFLQKELEQTSNGRIKDTEINSGNSGKNVLYEYYLKFDTEKMALANIVPAQFYRVLENQLHSGNLNPIVNDNEWQQVKLESNKYKKFNIWDLKNSPLTIDKNQYKLKELTSIEKKKTGNEIRKKNQQYHLVVAYDFIGPRPLAEKFKKEHIEKMSGILPIGYAVFEQSYGDWWNKNDQRQYYYIFVIVIIIFFICAILLESLRQPWAIIWMIPISFIGAFLTFYLFDFNFDQGGYAAFILLSGISVNAALYILNDFNNLKNKYPKKNQLELYFKSFNYKIIPILLTILSTIVGLIPFVWEGQKEPFWFSFAVGSIGGLLFSLLGILIYLPIFTLKKF